MNVRGFYRSGQTTLLTIYILQMDNIKNNKTIVVLKALAFLSKNCYALTHRLYSLKTTFGILRMLLRLYVIIIKIDILYRVSYFLK